MNERDRAEFAEFAAGRAGALIRLAYVLTGDQHAAEDLLQTALTRAAAHWGRIHTAPEAYVRQIMYREQVSWWRRRARHRETTMADPPDLLEALLPIQFRQVARIAGGSCPPRSHGLMMTASTLHSPQRPGGWIFQLGWLTGAQAQEFLGHHPARACLP